MFGTCCKCGATCTRVFLVERNAEEGMCSACIAVTYPRVDVITTSVIAHRAVDCEHPDLLPSLDAPHPRRERAAYEAWLNRPKQCRVCGVMVPEREL